jgi:hypothetical protein
MENLFKVLDHKVFRFILFVLYMIAFVFTIDVFFALIGWYAVIGILSIMVLIAILEIKVPKFAGIVNKGTVWVSYLSFVAAIVLAIGLDKYDYAFFIGCVAALRLLMHYLYAKHDRPVNLDGI